MKRHLILLAATAVVALAMTARADLTYSYSTTVSSWLGTPTYTSIATPSTATAQGNPSLGSGASYMVLSETFTPSSSFTLGQMDLITGANAGGVGGTIGVHLYDVTGVDKQAAGASYTIGTDLFGNGSGLSFNIPTTGAIQGIFTLNNGSTSDLVALTAGNTYALELWTPSAVAQNDFQWYRGGAVATDGQMMGSHDASSSVSRTTINALGLAGGAPRTADLALYTPVPEPSAVAMLSLGGGLMLLAWRRRKA